MAKRTFLTLALVLGISTNTQAPATAEVPREINMAPDVVPHPAAVMPDPVSDKPAVKPAIDPMKALLASLRKTDEKRAAAEEQRNSIWEVKTKIEAANTSLESDKANLAIALKQETARANKAEEQLIQKDKQIAETISQYQNFSGAIKGLFGLVIIGFFLLAIGVAVVLAKIIGGSRLQAMVNDDIMARLPGKANQELRKRCAELSRQLTERDDELAKTCRQAEEVVSKAGQFAQELQETRDRHSGQMERLGRVKADAEERVAKLTELLVLSLQAFRDAAKDFTDMSCPHGLDSMIALVAAAVEPSTVAPPVDKQLSLVSTNESK
jgi:septal ring factor EnvC (AmiA/AmiB activator)